MKQNSPKQSRLLLVAALLMFGTWCFAQNPALTVFEQWRDTVGSQNAFYKATTITVPGTTQILVCGATLNSSGDYDMLIQKINGSNGHVLWSQQYDGAGHGDDIAADVAVNSSTGDVYITGSYYESSADSNNAITIMYNSSGVQQWASAYNGTGSEIDATVALMVDDATGDVFSAGAEWAGANLYDMLLIKYDNTGSQQWVNTLDYANGNDGLNKVSINGGKPCVGGGVQDMFGSFEYAVFTFDLSSGGLGGGPTNIGTTPGINRLADLVVDDTGNVYITGFTFDPVTKYDIRTIKLDTNLSVVWSHDYDAGYNKDDEGTAIALDSHNNVIVVGYSKTVNNGKNYAILKYTNAGFGGFMTDYDDPYSGDDSATAVVIDQNDTNAIYVTGYSFNGSTNDYWTMKIDGVGNHIWEIGMNSFLNGDDQATAIALDSLGDVIVSGQNKLADTVFAYTTVKYVQKNTLLPEDTISFTSSSFIFTENRGQVMGTDTAQHPEVKFYTMHGSPNVYFMDTAVSYVFAKLDTSVASNDSIMRVDMKFVNSNPDQKIRPMDQREDYLNFFLPQVPEGRSNVPNYNQLVSFNVWNNVDIVYGSNLAGMKYYFVCKPLGGGGSSSQIDLYYDGADSVKIGAAGQLIIYTPLGNIVQPKPQVWQLDPSGNFSGLAWQPSYSIVGTNEVRFTGFGSYNVAWPLVIAADRGNAQPQNIQNLTWSTYYGGNTSGVYGEFNDIVVSQQRNAIVAGYSNSVDFPVSVFLTSWNPINGSDATVVKFKPNGQLDWATYYGGIFKKDGSTGSSDGAYSIDVDKAGNVLFVGSTQSYRDMPLVQWGSAYYRDTNECSGVGCTQLDAFIGYVTSNGQVLTWGTYLGGLNFDRALEVKVSPLYNDIYVCGTSRGGFPLDSSTALWNSTTGHGFITRFSPTGVMLWSTMIGSSASPSSGYYDGVSDIAIDKNGDVVFAGNIVGGPGFPVLQNTCADSSNNTFGGASGDAFISKFTGNTNDLVWSTFYGSNYFDYVWTIAVDSALNYYMTGYTQYGTGADTLPLVNPGGGAYFQSTFGGGTSDAFITEFDQNGCLVWSTLYGGNGRDEGFAVAIDSSQNVYTLGQTQSNNIQFAVPNLGAAYVDPSFNGGTNDYLNCFKATTHNQIWTTYFGSASSHPFGLGAFEDSTLYATGGVGGCATSGCFPLDNGGGPPVWFQDTITQVTGFISRFDINPSIVGINETESTEQLNLNVFPNPSDGTIWIQVPVATGEELVIDIYNVAGQLMYSETLSARTYLHRQLLLEGYSSGMYVVHVHSGNLVFNKKIIIRH